MLISIDEKNGIIGNCLPFVQAGIDHSFAMIQKKEIILITRLSLDILLKFFKM